MLPRDQFAWEALEEPSTQLPPLAPIEDSTQIWTDEMVVGPTDPNEVVSVAVTFEDVPFDFSRFRDADSATREALIEERQFQLTAAHAETQERLAGLQAVVTGGLWIANVLYVDLPAGRIPELRTWEGVVSVRRNHSNFVNEAYDGDTLRTATLADRVVDDGFGGNGYQYGVIEDDNWMARTHVSFNRGNGTSRVSQVYDCNACCWQCSPSANNTNNSHGTYVSWVALGSIEAGQDSNFPGTGTVSQLDRSGQAPDTQLFYYNTNDCDAKGRAIQRAVQDGVDAASMSWLVRDWLNNPIMCDRTYDCGGVNAAISNATTAGVILFKSAGNQGPTTGCRLTWPAYRPDVISVGALDNTTNSTTGYGSLGKASYSSQGGLVYRRWDGGMRTMAGIGLAAPGEFILNATNAPNSYNSGLSILGTSFAAPAVGGAAILLKDALDSIGYGYNNDARVLQNMLLLAGDNGTAAGGELTTGLSVDFGLGRLRLHYPSNNSITAPWAWDWRRFAAFGAGTHSFNVVDANPEPLSATQWKWVTFIVENDLNSVGTDYSIRVVDTCPPGGGTEVVRTDTSSDLRKHITLTQGEICVAGRPQCRCLQKQIVVARVPTAGQSFFSSDYYHSGSDVAEH